MNSGIDVSKLCAGLATAWYDSPKNTEDLKALADRALEEAYEGNCSDREAIGYFLGAMLKGQRESFMEYGLQVGDSVFNEIVTGMEDYIDTHQPDPDSKSSIGSSTRNPDLN